MIFSHTIIEIIFSSSLFINALLFIPQAILIFKKKNSADVSLLTFLGFLLIQFAIVLHGIINRDYLLVVGYLFSMLTCGSVVALAFFYRKLKKSVTAQDIPLEEVLDQLPEHVYWKDKNLVMVGSNVNNWRDFGLKSLSDFKGKTDFDILPFNEAEKVQILDGEIIRTGQGKIVEERMSAAGKNVLYLSNKIPLKNKDNEIVGLLGVSVDITHAKQEEVDRLEMLENIIAIMPGNVYWMNKEGIYLGCNNNQAKAANLPSRKDIVGKRNVEIPGFLIPEVLDPINKQVMEEGKIINVEEPAILADGTEATFFSSKVPLYDDRGSISGMVGISIDITEKKQSQKALEAANRARLEFISTASHEIRNPIASVIALGGFLENNLTTLRDIIPAKGDELSVEAVLKVIDKAFDWCRDLRSESERALSALKNLGALHRMQLNGVTTCFEVFNIQQLIEIAIEESTYPNTNAIKIEKSIHSLVPGKISIDSKNIITALSIVIGNALRFSHAGGKINISVRATQKNQKTVLIIAVQDFGVGMHDQQIKNLLLTVPNKPSIESIYVKPSVQLSRVRMYVEASGGELAIKSVLEEGTTVELTIPYDLPIEKSFNSKTIKNVLHDDEEHDVEKAIIHNVHEPICSVLLVEDDVTIQKITSEELMGLGYDLDVSSNGAEAIKMAMKKDYEIILLDISLPDMNGLEVMRKIRMSKGDEIIFIALSSHSTEEDEEYFIKQGAMALIAKPLKIKQIKEMMEIGLKIKREH